MSGSVSPFEAGWSITKESDDKPDRFDFNAEYDPTGLVPEGYAEKHPNEYWEEAHGKGFHPSDWEEMSEEERDAYDERYFSNPMPYPRPLGLLPHSEINRYRDLLDEFRRQFSRFEHNPNLSEDERMELAVSLFDPANEAANLSEDFAEAIANEISYRSQEQTVDAGRRGDIHAGGWKNDGTPFKPRGKSTHLPFSQQFQDIHTGEPMTIRSLLLKALGDPDEMFWWDRRYGGSRPSNAESGTVRSGGGGAMEILNWLKEARNQSKIDDYLMDDGKPRTIDIPLDRDYILPEFADIRDNLPSYMRNLKPEKVGHFGKPGKMPGPSIMDSPPRACIYSTPDNPNSACGNCYACHNNYKFNNSQNALWRNLDQMLTNPEEVASAYALTLTPRAMLDRESRRDDIVARVFSAGDARGAGAFAMADKIAEENPNVDLWGSTRQYDLLQDFLDARGWDYDAVSPNMAFKVSLPGRMTTDQVNPDTEFRGVNLYELGKHPNVDFTTYDAVPKNDPSFEICPSTVPGNPKKCNMNIDPVTGKKRCRSCFRTGVNVGYLDHDEPRIPMSELENWWQTRQPVDSGLDITQFMRKI